jgi:hypothetical protein
MTLKGYIKYNILKKNKKIITEDYFCNKLRNNEQNKLITKIKELKVDISQLKLNWNYISLTDNLTIKFISYFKEYINFHDLSLNKNLTTKHLEKFKEDLEWDILSEHYNFTLDDLHIYKNYINWKYIFFYKNTPSDIIKDDFNRYMWWLFLNDRIYNENDITYAKHNDMIINKNMNSIPKQLIDRFEYTLLEYKRNKIILKDVLKIQLNSLYDEFINNKEIIDLKKIDCNIFRVERKDQEIQNGVKMRLKITCDQSNQTNLKTKNFSTQTESLDEENEDSDLDIVCEEILDEIVISELCDEIINRDDSTDEI